MILYNLIPTQPSPFSAFHGGGLYGEVVFIGLASRAKKGSVACYYDSARPLGKHLVELAEENNIPLIDCNTESIKAVILRLGCKLYYSPGIEPLPEESDLGCHYLGTIHGPRELEMFIDSTAIHFASGVKEKASVILKIILQNWLIARRWRPMYESALKNPAYSFIAVSEHTKYSMVGLFPFIDPTRVNVFYSPLLDQLGDEDSKEATLPESISCQKYILMTSGNRWVKNSLRALLAMDSIFSDNTHQNLKCVVTGVPQPEIFRGKLKNLHKFHFMGYVERDLLNALHKNAYAFLYPSLNEGFGYPPVESMKYGVPVAASGITSIPEVCQNAALYFNPYSIQEIKNRILQLLDSEIHERLKGLCCNQYVKISDRQAKDLDSLLDHMIQLAHG